METNNPVLELPLPQVLVVDDTADHRDLQTRWLEASGYDVATAVSVGDARAKLGARRPDLLLLDVCLPDGSGIDFCRELKRDPRWDELVVVLISSEQISPDMKANGLDAGAHDYLERPIARRLFLTRVNMQVRLQLTRRVMQRAQVDLERRVEERTRQLATANLELRREIEERRRAEVKLQESESRFRVIAENARDLISVIDPRGRYAYVSPSYERILGYNAAQVAALEALEVTHPEDLAKVSDWRDCPSHEFRARKADGSWVWMEGCSYPISWLNETYVVAVAREITERKGAAEALRELPQKILAAQENERRRVSRDLHDSVNQLLASVRFRVEAVEGSLTGDPALARETLAKVKELLGSAMQEVRRISRNLRPGELDDFGLLAALRSATEEFALRTRMRVDLEADDAPERLEPELELQFYRIVQEALNNVEKHAGATRLVIRLVSDDARDCIWLEIRDNGCGLPAARGTGLGLINMRERAAACGGTCEVFSEPGAGVLIRVCVPLHSGAGKISTQESNS